MLDTRLADKLLVEAFDVVRSPAEHRWSLKPDSMIIIYHVSSQKILKTTNLHFIRLRLNGKFVIIPN